MKRFFNALSMLLKRCYASNDVCNALGHCVPASIKHKNTRALLRIITEREAPPGSSLFILFPPAWIRLALVPPGYSWLLQVPHCSSLVLMAPPGVSWLR